MHDHQHSLRIPAAHRPEASLHFYREALGFEARNSVGYESMRWIVVGPEGEPEV